MDIIETHNNSTHVKRERDITNGFAMCRPQKQIVVAHSEGNSSCEAEGHFDQSGGRRQLRDSELDSYN
jgi:hypothetical protein